MMFAAFLSLGLFGCASGIYKKERRTNKSVLLFFKGAAEYLLPSVNWVEV